MEEDFFLKNMKGVKPFKKDTSIVKTKTTNKKNVKLDKKTLKNLVSQDVYNAFEKAIDENTNNPSAQFYSLIIDSVENAKVENNTISISLNFISEQMLNNDEGSIVKNKDTWTFEKPVNSSSPIWILTQT